jgi:hypothetical protein
MISSTPQSYARHDTWTDPGMFSDLYDDLPADVSDLRDVVSRLKSTVFLPTFHCLVTHNRFPTD